LFVVGVLDSPVYRESSLSDWLAKAPHHLLANNLGLSEKAIASFNKKRMAVTPAWRWDPSPSLEAVAACI
jgi:oxalate decarboxylase